MKQGWEVRKLGDVCDLQNGFAFKSNDYVEFSNTMNFRMSQIRPDGGIDLENNPKYLPDDYAIKYKNYLLTEGDVVIAMTDLATETKILGVPTIVPKDNRNWLLNQRVGKLFNIDLSMVEVTYLKYILTSSSVNEYYKSLGRGGLQINIGKQDILNAKIPLPPLQEQQRIVAILDEAFAAIAQAKANAEQNLQNAKELFDIQIHKYYSSKEAGWEEKSLREIAEYFNGLTYSPKNVCEEEGIIVLRSSNVQNNQLDFNDVVRVNLTVKDKIIVKEGDILMCSRNGSKRLVGKTATIKNLDEEMTFGTFMMIIRSQFNPYLSWFFKSNDFRKQISGGENTMINQITRYMLDEVILSFPPIEIQNEIVQKLDALSTETKQLEVIYQQKINDLDELKKSILQKAFAGELNTSALELEV